MNGFNSTHTYFLETFFQQAAGSEPMTKLLAIFSVFLISICCCQFRKKKFKPQPPGPIGLPLLGYFPFLGKDVLKTFNELSKKYGSVFSFYLGQRYVVVTSDWKFKTELFNQSASLNRPPWLFDLIPNGLGIIGANGSEWQKQKRFCMRVLKDIGFGRPAYEKMLQEEANDALKRVEEYQGKPVDLIELFSPCFATSVMSLLFGYRLPYNHPITKKVSRSLDSIMLAFPAVGFINFAPTLCKFLSKFGLYGSTEDLEAAQEFGAFVKDIVKKQLQNTENNDDESFIAKYSKEIENNKKYNLNNGFTESSLYGNCQAFLLAGSDTTKNSTLWLLIAMAQFPEVQDKVHQELDKVVGRDGEINSSMRSKIPYTYACILESLRWKTLAAINPLRITSEDTEVFGYHIPKDTIIFCNNWGMHYDTKYWPNPEIFEPERFLVDGGKQVDSKLEGYSPFSNGKRNCPGEQIAFINLIIYFAKFMQKFKILPDGKNVKYDAVLSLAYMPLNVQLRFISRI